MTELRPAFADFAKSYEAGKPQIVARALVADLDTHASSRLKPGLGDLHAFLLESVQGGETRGRYSIIGLKPDLIWRCRGNRAELNTNVLRNPEDFKREAKAPLDSLRDLIARIRIDLPSDLPPMASGLFGYLG